MSHQIGSRTPRRDTYVGFCLYDEEEEDNQLCPLTVVKSWPPVLLPVLILKKKNQYINFFLIKELFLLLSILKVGLQFPPVWA